ncbi:MAG: hypothetical protein ACK49V_13905, partial [Actinomycetes bacterium]
MAMDPDYPRSRRPLVDPNSPVHRWVPAIAAAAVLIAVVVVGVVTSGGGGTSTPPTTTVNQVVTGSTNVPVTKLTLT